jgi:hypothetical protein
MEQSPFTPKIKTQYGKLEKALNKEKIINDMKENPYEPLKYILGIEDVKTAEELIDKLSNVKTNAGFEKVFSRLKDLGNLKDVKVIYKSLNYLLDLAPGQPYETMAMYNQSSKTLFIDSTYSNVADIGEFYVTILHELFHHVFKGASIASGLNMIYAITDIKNTIHKLPIHNKYRHLFQTVLSNIPKEEVRNHYGLSSVDEFISEAYSNPIFQNFLKSVKLENDKSATKKTVDLLLSVATLNARIISHKISEEDAFAAFKNIDLGALDLLEDFEENMNEINKKHD